MTLGFYILTRKNGIPELTSNLTEKEDKMKVLLSIKNNSAYVPIPSWQLVCL